MSKSEKKNQLTDIKNYDTKRMIFCEPKQDQYGNTRIHVNTLNKDGSYGDLLFCSEEDLYSFGFKENVYNGQQNGWVFSLCLQSQDGATESQKQWIDSFNKLVTACKQYLVNHKEEIECVDNDLTLSDLRKVHPIRTKNKKGEDVPPVLNAKVSESKKNPGKFMSNFFDNNGNPVDPMNIKGKPCNTTAVIQLESIFLGSKTSIQIKLYEATVETRDSNRKSFLRPESQGRIMVSSSTNLNDDEDEEDFDKVVDKAENLNIDDDEAEGSLDEDEPEPVVEKPKPKLKRRVKTVKKTSE